MDKKNMATSSQSSNAPTTQKTKTRAQSEKAIASLDGVRDRAAIEEFLKNPNKRLAARAEFKLADTEARAALTAARKAKKTAP